MWLFAQDDKLMNEVMQHWIPKHTHQEADLDDGILWHSSALSKWSSSMTAQAQTRLYIMQKWPLAYSENEI